MENVIHVLAVISIVVTEVESATPATDPLALGEIRGSGKNKEMLHRKQT